MIEGYRKMSAARKLQIMQDLINTACLLVMGTLNGGARKPILIDSGATCLEF